MFIPLFLSPLNKNIKGFIPGYFQLFGQGPAPSFLKELFCLFSHRPSSDVRPSRKFPGTLGFTVFSGIIIDNSENNLVLLPGYSIATKGGVTQDFLVEEALA